MNSTPSPALHWQSAERCTAAEVDTKQSKPNANDAWNSDTELEVPKPGIKSNQNKAPIATN